MRKYVKYYIVTDNDYDYKNMKVYTVCETREDALEFMDKYLFLKNVEHYQSWCALRKLNFKSKESWNEYKEATDIKSDLMMLKIKNTLNNLLSIVRSAQYCPCVGCQYETDYEVKRFKGE